MKEFLPIETPYNSEDYKIMKDVTNMESNSISEGFTKSEFKKSPTWSNKFLWNIHESELPTLYKRLEELYTKTKNEDYIDFLDEVTIAVGSKVPAEVTEMIDPYDPMDGNQTVDGHPTQGSDLNNIADDAEYDLDEAELKEFIQKRMKENFQSFIDSDTSTENTIDDDTVSQELASENSSDSLANKHGENLKPEPLIDEDSQTLRHLAGQREKIGEVPLGQHAPHSQATIKITSKK